MLITLYQCMLSKDQSAASYVHVLCMHSLLVMEPMEMFSCSSASSICLFSRSSVCFSVCLTMGQNEPQNTLNFLGESASRPSWNVVRFSESRSECLCLSFPRKDLAKVKCCHVLTSVNKFQPPPTDKEVVYHPVDACWVST